MLPIITIINNLRQMGPDHDEDNDGLLSPRFILPQAGLAALGLVGAGVWAVSSGWWQQMSDAVFQNLNPQRLLDACAVGGGVLMVLALVLIQQWRRIARLKKVVAQSPPKTVVADRDAQIRRLEREKSEIQHTADILAGKLQQAESQKAQVEREKTQADQARAATEQSLNAEVEGLRMKLREIVAESHKKSSASDAWRAELEPFKTNNGEVYRIKAESRARLGDYFLCPICCNEGQPARLHEIDANGRKSLHCSKHNQEWVLAPAGVNPVVLDPAIAMFMPTFVDAPVAKPAVTPAVANPPVHEVSQPAAAPAAPPAVPAPAPAPTAAPEAAPSDPGLTPVHYQALRALATSPILVTPRILSALVQAPLSAAEKILDELSNFSPPLASKTHTQVGLDGFGWKTTAEGAKVLAEARNA